VPLSRAAIEWWVLTVGLVALVLGLGHFAELRPGNLITRIDSGLYDIGLRRWAAAPREDVVIVAVDDTSLAQVGRWPWRRAISARLLESIQAAGPRVIGVDLLFVESAEGDEQLGLAARGGAPVVLPVARHRATHGRDRPLLPIPELGAGRLLGHVEFAPDPDGVIRGLYLREGGFDAMSWLLARGRLEPGDGEQTLDLALEAPQWEREDLVRPGGLSGRVTQIPAATLLRGEAGAAALRDRIVLVGATARGLGDTYSTTVYADASLVSGVELHAAAVSAMLDARLVRDAPAPWRLSLMAAILVAVMTWLYFTEPRGGLLAVTVAIVGVIAATVAALGAGWWLAPGSLLIGLVLAFPLWSWRRLSAASAGLIVEAAQLEAEGEPLADARPESPEPTRSSEPIAQHLQRLHNAAARIRRLNHNLNTTLERLQAAQREREQTLRFLSHDLRAPHLAILSLLQAGRAGGPPAGPDAVRDAGPDAARDRGLDAGAAAQIAKHSSRALELTDGFMQLARAESQPLQRVPHDLLDLANEAADACWQLARERGVRIVVTAPRAVGGHAGTDSGRDAGHDAGRDPQGDAAAPCTCDAQLVRRALVNLLDNATRFGPRGSTVTLGIEHDHGGWRLSVGDDGPGIAPENLPHVFEPYWRGPQRMPHEGAGLGLAFVAAVSLRHGGTVSASNRMPRGACLELWLPSDANP